MLAGRVVALVGSRRASPYGERIAALFATAFARASVCVLSGLAYGIDVAALRAALDVDGRTCAVLGTGLDVFYPAAHRDVQRQIAARGFLLSEYAAGTTARPWHFPTRNRLMAALGQATIVVEAGATSGALLTAQIALDLGRPVGAVPGAIDSPESLGANSLLSQPGVTPIGSVADALALVGAQAPKIIPARDLSPDEIAVCRALPAADLEDLALRTSLPTERCHAIVSSLELSQALKVALDGSIHRVETGDIS
jgi:DNA processing protein